MDAVDGKKPFKIKDVTRNIKKAVVASSLEEIRQKVAEKFDKPDQLPTIHLDSDGTEVDDEDYFRTLDENAELIAVFPGQHWVDPTRYVTIKARSNGDSVDPTAETARLKQLVGQLQNNICNVSLMNDADMDLLSNMDPNSLVDITGKEFMDQLKDPGRALLAKRTAEDRINLLRLLREGAIFCSERYPEDAEAIDKEISRQLELQAKDTNLIIHAVETITQHNHGTPLAHDTHSTCEAIITKTIDRVQTVHNGNANESTVLNKSTADI